MIEPIRERRAFERLARDGTRVRRTALWCTCHLDPELSEPRSPGARPPAEPARVAFALGRTLGTAVTRNRLRRRLRAILREIDRTAPLPPVLLLIGARPAATELTFGELRTETVALIAEVRRACSA